jgi:hypothetical protein
MHFTAARFLHTLHGPLPRVRANVLLASVPLFLLGFTWMFRSWLLSGFDVYFGGDDNRLLVSLLEHWFRFFSGLEGDWRSPRFFYPERNVLAFSDAFFLYAFPYSIFRTLGVEPSNSFMLVIAVLSAIGFVSFMRLSITLFGAMAWTAAVGAFLFVFADMIAMKMVHAQSYCAMLLPVVVYLAARAYKADSREVAMVFATAGGALHAFIFFTAFLTGWFFTFSCVLALVVYCVLAGRARSIAFARFVFNKKRSVLLAYLLAFAIGLLPFALLYAPVVFDGRRHSALEFVRYQPSFWDIINVGPRNFLWGSFLGSVGIVEREGRAFWEMEIGYSPIVFATWVTLVCLTAIRIWRNPIDATLTDRIIVTLGVTLILSWLIQLNYFGFQPWQAVRYLVPGAIGVRTTFRMQIVSNFGACILVVLALERIQARWRSASLPIVGLAVVMLIEQVDTQTPLTNSRSEEWAWMSAVPSPPADCRVFYIVPGAKGVKFQGTHQVDAALVATFFGIPTINGNSSVFPRDWEFRDVARSDYVDAMRRWINQHSLSEGLCGLEPRTGRWKNGGP